MNISLQNDWTLAHFISYIAAITAVLLGIQLLTHVIMFNEVGMDFPVKYFVENPEQPSSITRDGYMFLPDNQQKGRLIIKETDNRSDLHSLILATIKLIESAMFIFCAFLVWRIFQAVASDQPFSVDNYKRLFIVGWIFVIAELFALGRAFYIEWLAFDTFTTESFRLIRTTGDLTNFMIIGIMIIVIGYVFKEGNRIYEEQKLTV